MAKKTISIGKISYYGNRRCNEVELNIELAMKGGEGIFTVDRTTGERTPTGRYAPQYIEFTASANIWSANKSNIVCGGQCFEDIKRLSDQLTDENRKLFDEVYDLWKNWHLNSMNAGTPEQEAALKEWAANGGDVSDYVKRTKVLKEKGLYEVPFTGMTVGKVYNGERYRYASGWVVKPIPGDVLARINALLGEASVVTKGIDPDREVFYDLS